MEDATFDEEFRTLFPQVRRFTAAFLNDPARGEEIAQEAMLRLYRAGPDRPVGDEARAWVLHVARNLAINAARRRRLWGRISGELRQAEEPRYPGPEDAFDRRRLLRRAWAELALLPERQRAALLLREQEGLSYREIADALRVSLATVKVSIFRARSFLRARSGRREGRARAAR